MKRQRRRNPARMDKIHDDLMWSAFRLGFAAGRRTRAPSPSALQPINGRGIDSDNPFKAAPLRTAWTRGYQTAMETPEEDL